MQLAPPFFFISEGLYFTALFAQLQYDGIAIILRGTDLEIYWEIFINPFVPGFFFFVDFRDIA